MALPVFQTSIRELSMMQTQWSSQLNPVLGLPLLNGPSTLKNITIKSGSNVINHLLGKTPQGWLVIDQNAAITLYRSAPFNDLTLTLTSSGAATISLIVF